ncbi:hypothetical protein MKZ38_006067 [Zalerion maritima]|uniref:Uncharacterized protein n=1 Tax=Zalerion maritima TaxID=339359 RepID=A0AAD5RK83_9PEZI|nr:hypothetical protein MKZ38_006067 [Zalerion maritima]
MVDYKKGGKKRSSNSNNYGNNYGNNNGSGGYKNGNDNGSQGHDGGRGRRGGGGGQRKPRKFAHRDNFENCLCDREKCKQMRIIKKASGGDGLGLGALGRTGKASGLEALGDALGARLGGVGGLNPYALNSLNPILDPISGEYHIPLGFDQRTNMDNVLKTHLEKKGHRIVDADGDFVMAEAPSPPRTSFPPGPEELGVAETVLVRELRRQLEQYDITIKELEVCLKREREQRRAVEDQNDTLRAALLVRPQQGLRW